eukprot:6190482-Pleurochrysis_carterae.AAC.4
MCLRHFPLAPLFPRFSTPGAPSGRRRGAESGRDDQHQHAPACSGRPSPNEFNVWVEFNVWNEFYDRNKT